MAQYFKNKWFVFLVYCLLGLSVLYMFIQIKSIFIALISFMKAVFLPFAIAMIISYVLNPIVSLLGERNVPRTIAVLLIYALFMLTGTVVLMNLTPVFITQLNELHEHLPQFTMRAQSFILTMNENDLLPEGVRKGINDALMKAEQQLAQSISSYIQRIGSTINAMFVAFIIPFLAFYMLKDFQMFERAILSFVPTEHKHRTVRLVNDIDKALGNYIRGQFLVCIIVGLLAYMGYVLIDLPYPLLLAAIVGVFNIIPYVGPFFGAAPALLVASTVSIKLMLLVVAVNFLCQLLEGNVISPQIVGRTLHMHPLLIILVLLIGGEIGGLAGLILAVPIFAVGKVIVHHAWLYYKHRKPVS
jgi:predicted PurR-regulated permease PerM